MGKVLLGRRGDQLGAVKVLRGEADPDEEARFALEVEVLGSLRHAAIVRLLDHGVHDEAPFLVMEFVEGESLEARLARGEAIPARQAVPMFAALADGLRHAHEHGIHHRDVKSDNVVVRADGHAMLVDFGVALKRGASRLTSAGFVMGTFTYLPPEVIEGDVRDPAASDIYALGQLLVESLVGRLLFRGDPNERNSRKRWTALTAEKASSGPLDPGEAFAEPLRAICRRATHPEPEERYPKIGELADDLRALLDAEQEALLDSRLGDSWVGATPVPVRRLRPGPPRTALVAATALVLVGFSCGGGLALIALLVVGLWLT